ncbi:MAG: hypothetical protein JWP36_1182 [Paucimonas sp.]|nr:hypothetical protein [Paucimonas sp.]
MFVTPQFRERVLQPAFAQPSATPASFDARSVYFSALAEQANDTPGTQDSDDATRGFLQQQLGIAQSMSCDLPRDPRELPAWLDHGVAETGRQYRSYIAGRKAGAARRFFTNKSHALHFLRGVAPTKLVDGAWLYGLLQRWDDQRFAALIRIYLEELGEGVPDKNHVVIYRKLLARHGCDEWQDLPEDHFTQGAIQLALARHAADFLPEVIGFNLGYEQLPLHLPVTAYELDELGIDPWYFTLHVTIDNAASGHARKAMRAVADAMPTVGDAGRFYQRVANGYKLNMLGACTTSVIESFDLEQALLSVFKSKARIGAMMHADYCRVGGRSVSDWLSSPGQMPAFLASMEQAGWIKRNQDPADSRFWKLLDGERAAMFGVFNGYEQQLIHDWIAGDWAGESAGKQPRQISFRASQRLHESLAQPAVQRSAAQGVRGLLRNHARQGALCEDTNDMNVELRLLEEKLAATTGREEALALLTPLMSPARHHTPSGLMATRIFNRLFA